MKCFSGSSRGIVPDKSWLSKLRVPVVYDESILRDPTATFLGKLVFADVEKRDGKIIFSAQQADDGVAIIDYGVLEGLGEDDLDDAITHDIVVSNATIIHSEESAQYLGFWTYCNTCNMVLTMEAGGSAVVTTKRIIKHSPGIFAWLGGSRKWTEEQLRVVRLSYDGNDVTVVEEPIHSRKIEPEVRTPRTGWLALTAC